MSQQLVTGEAVALDLRPAALPSRLLAGVLDALLQVLLLLIVGGTASAVSLELSSAASAALTIVVLVTVLLVYPIAFESLLRGRTPGKAAMGLRVVRDDGGPIGFRQALVRGLLGGFVERFGITLFAGAIISMLLNDKSKRLGDLFAGTVVVQERVAVRGGQVAKMPAPLAAWASSLDLSGLSNDLALSVRQFLARERDLTPQAREDLGGRLVQSVLACTSPPPPPGTPGWAVLPAVLAERRRRAETGATPPPSAPAAEAPRPAPVAPATPDERPVSGPAGGFAPPG